MVSVSFGVPKELFNALNKGGFSLLIKGLAGTGKTTLALELIKKMGKEGTGYYVSTRVSSKKLLRQFPWIKDSIPEENILDARKPQIPVSAPEYVLFEYSDEPDFLRALYAKIESSKKRPVTIVIDSLDALKTNLDIPLENLRIEKALLELGESTNSNVIFVVERYEALPIDYLVDGIVTLTREIVHGRLIRKIIFEKIRGEEIKKPTFLFTLKDGRFKHFRDMPIYFPEKVASPPLITSDERISTGVEDLNNLMAGGYRRGSFNLLEIGEEVGPYYLWLIAPLVASLVQHNIPVMIIPCQGEPVEELERWIIPFVGEERFNACVKILEVEEAASGKPYIVKIPRGDASQAHQIASKTVKQLREKLGSEDLALIIGVDTVEHVYDPQTVYQFLSQLSILSRTRNFLVLAIVKYGQKLIRTLCHMATTHFKLENIEGTTVIYGLIPRTEMYVMTVNTEKGYVETRLIPIE